MMKKVIYFDIGETLGSVELNLDGQVVELHVYPQVEDVLQRLHANGHALGVLSNTGDRPGTEIDAALDRSGLGTYLEPELRLYSSEVGITKAKIEMFEFAIGRGGRVTGDCPEVFFVGENRSERTRAGIAGMTPVSDVMLVEDVVSGESFGLARIGVSAMSFSDRRRHAHLRQPGVAAVGQDPIQPEWTLALTTESGKNRLRRAGLKVEECFGRIDVGTSDLFLARDGHAKEEPGVTVLGSCEIGELVAVGADGAGEGAHGRKAHGHLQQLLPVQFGAQTREENAAALNPELSAAERQIIGSVITEANLEREIGKLIGEEDGIGTNRHVRSPQMKELIDRSAADLELQGQGMVEVKLHEFSISIGAPPLGAVIPSWNVVGELKGQTDELVLVTAHIDSTSEASHGPAYDPLTHAAPGADDDASGVAAVLLAANVCSLVFKDHQPLRTIQFVMFNAEEQGLLGSARYARLLAAQGRSVAAVFQMDMIGYNGAAPNSFETHAGTTRQLPVQDPQLEASALGLARLVRGLSEHLREHGLSILEPAQVYGSPDGAAGRSDHASFLNAGYPACVTSEDFFADPGFPADANPNYHGSGDLVVDLPFATSIARVIAGAAIRSAQPQIDEFEFSLVAEQPAPLEEEVEGRCVTLAGGKRFCTESLARLTPELALSIARALPKLGKGLSRENKKLAERLIGPLNQAEQTLSLTDSLERLTEAVRLLPGDNRALEQQLFDEILGPVGIGFAQQVFLTDSFQITYQTTGAAAVDPTAGAFDIEEPGISGNIVESLPASTTPNYVRRIAYWLERSLQVYTSPPFGLRNPAAGGRLEAFIIDTDFGGANLNGFFIGNEIPPDMIAAVSVHELFHMVQFEYNNTGSWRDSMVEGGATFAEDAVADALNRYLYETGDGFNGPGYFIDPNQSLHSSAARYKSALFWRYTAERRPVSGLPGSGAETYAEIIGECGASGYRLASVETGIRNSLSGAEFYQFRYLDAAREFLESDETIWGNFSFALLARDLAGPDRRFRFDEDDEEIRFDEALQQVPLNVPMQDRAGQVARDRLTIGNQTETAQLFVRSFASRYFEVEIEETIESVVVELSPNPGLTALVQIGVVEGDALVDLYRMNEGSFRRTLKPPPASGASRRLLIAVSGIDSSGSFSLEVGPADPEADLHITRWNCLPGTHYSIDPAGGAWNFVSPDLWFDFSDSADGRIFVRVRNQGAAESEPAECRFEYQPVEPGSGVNEWFPANEPDGEPVVLECDSLEAGSEVVLSGKWTPGVRSPIDAYLVRVRLTSGSQLLATAVSQLAIAEDFAEFRRDIGARVMAAADDRGGRITKPPGLCAIASSNPSVETLPAELRKRPLARGTAPVTGRPLTVFGKGEP